MVEAREATAAQMQAMVETPEVTAMVTAPGMKPEQQLELRQQAGPPCIASQISPPSSPPY